MNEIKVVRCDECNHEFDITQGKGKVREKTYSKGITKTYFICPNCNKEYISHWTNGSIRRKQKAIKDTWAKIRTSALTTSVLEQERMYKQIEMLKEGIRLEMKELKERMEG